MISNTGAGDPEGFKNQFRFRRNPKKWFKILKLQTISKAVFFEACSHRYEDLNMTIIFWTWKIELENSDFDRDL
jgi:hypothetical protein